MATSILYPGELVIDDSSPHQWHSTPPGQSKGLMYPDDMNLSYVGVAEPFPTELIIPKSEWQARIEEMEATKSRLSDLANQYGLPCKDQNGTNYCWINAPTHCIEIIRMVQNEPMVILSPASSGAQIKSYSNVGGWGKEGLEWITEHGCVPIDKWPANAIDRKYATKENLELALNYRDTEWWVLDGSLEQMVSCLLRRIPIASGLAWWSHEVTYYEVVWINGTVGIRMRNSWGMNWPNQGSAGYSILQGNKMMPDDAVAARVAIAA